MLIIYFTLFMSYNATLRQLYSSFTLQRKSQNFIKSMTFYDVNFKIFL